MLGITGHRIGDAYRSLVSNVTLDTESKFVESGTLTPQEFVQAGDQLTFKFQTWAWAVGDASRRFGCLPQNKQYLITRNVPCLHRVRGLDHVLKFQTVTEGDWLVPETANSASGPAEEICDIDDLTKQSEDTKAVAETEESSGGFFGASEDFINEGGGMMDFGDLDAQLAEQDAGMAVTDVSASGGYNGGCIVAEAPDANIVHSRTYDLCITYDKYYQTPRLWLFGYDEHGHPLKPDQVYEDVLSEYVAKTVTFDPHPLTGIPTVSIHPCKHAQVMKRVVQDWIEKGIEPRHDLALFVFLKFISGVVPTINYDFTMDIEF